MARKQESKVTGRVCDCAGAEERRLYTTLPRPLPDYALAHVFAQYGPVDFVRLQSDARHGVVQFASAESAAAALAGLAGSDICGQVRHSASHAKPPASIVVLLAFYSIHSRHLVSIPAQEYPGLRWLAARKVPDGGCVGSAGAGSQPYRPSAAGAQLETPAHGALRRLQAEPNLELGASRDDVLCVCKHSDMCKEYGWNEMATLGRFGVWVVGLRLHIVCRL